jgi:hypothetical protein
MENVGLFYVHLVYFMSIWSILCPFGLFYGHLVYFTAIGNILWPFGIFCGHLVYFSPFWYIVPKEIWQPWRQLSSDVMIRRAKTVLSRVLLSATSFLLIWSTTNFIGEFSYLQKQLCVCSNM